MVIDVVNLSALARRATDRRAVLVASGPEDRPQVHRARQGWGVTPGGPPSPPNSGPARRGLVPRVVGTVPASPGGRSSNSTAKHHAWIGSVQVTTIHQRLRDDLGLSRLGVLAAALHRGELRRGRGPRCGAGTRDTPPPGEEAQVNYGLLGRWLDPGTGRGFAGCGASSWCSPSAGFCSSARC